MALMNILDHLQKLEVILTFPEKEHLPASVIKQCPQKRVFQHIEEQTLQFQSIGLKNLFVAICKRSNLEPFRYASQKDTTVVIHTSKSVLTEELLPRFKKYERLCVAVAEKVMKDITSQIYEIEEDDVKPD